MGIWAGYAQTRVKSTYSAVSPLSFAALNSRRCVRTSATLRASSDKPEDESTESDKPWHLQCTDLCSVKTYDSSHQLSAELVGNEAERQRAGLLHAAIRECVRADQHDIATQLFESAVTAGVRLPSRTFLAMLPLLRPPAEGSVHPRYHIIANSGMSKQSNLNKLWVSYSKFEKQRPSSAEVTTLSATDDGRQSTDHKDNARPGRGRLSRHVGGGDSVVLETVVENPPLDDGAHPQSPDDPKFF